MTFYFYDLETSSGSARNGRIMQFAGQRTDENLQPIGEPHNLLVALSDDVIPEPDAILVHGITPQQTLSEGYSEAAFAKLFINEIAQPDTVFVGYNNIRFDDEFTRALMYRTFYDPYQWHWQDNRSRWDLLDPIRMMRALRPEGLQWPIKDGKPTVKLELLAKENGLLHENAHDALSDVQALIQLAQKFKSAQPRLFDYLLQLRDKKKVAEIVASGEPFLYTSGKYSSDHEKTTAVMPLGKHPTREAALVYDLRHDPAPWQALSPEKLAEHWAAGYQSDIEPLPIKTMQYNRCPAIAPLSVLDEQSAKRIAIDMETIRKHAAVLGTDAGFLERLQTALAILEKKQQTTFLPSEDVDAQLYDGFWNQSDQHELAMVRATEPAELQTLLTTLKNKRLREMLPRYKARNFQKALTAEERSAWDAYRRSVFYGGKTNQFEKFSRRMGEIAKERTLTENEQYLLTELQLYVESILPEPED